MPARLRAPQALRDLQRDVRLQARAASASEGGRILIIRGRVISFNATVKGKGEDAETHGKLVIETDDLDEWQVELLVAALDGTPHRIGIDE